jgi:hypothetical protein
MLVTMPSKFGRFRDVLWSLVTLATAAGVPRVLIVDELRRLAGRLDNEGEMESQPPPA